MNEARKRAILTVREAHYAWSQKSHTDGTFTLAHARGKDKGCSSGSDIP